MPSRSGDDDRRRVPGVGDARGRRPRPVARTRSRAGRAAASVAYPCPWCEGSTVYPISAIAGSPASSASMQSPTSASSRSRAIANWNGSPGTPGSAPLHLADEGLGLLHACSPATTGSGPRRRRPGTHGRLRRRAGAKRRSRSRSVSIEVKERSRIGAASPAAEPTRPAWEHGRHDASRCRPRSESCVPPTSPPCATSSAASPTTPFTVVARCTGGHPLVIRNAPIDAAGDPFPTTYWLTCPERRQGDLSDRVRRDGSARLNERMTDDDGFRAAVEAAARRVCGRPGDRPRRRPRVGRRWPARASGIKCLHAHYAYQLAGGDDPVGAWVAERIEPVHAEQRHGRVAAIDQGTNSIRLLVVEPAAEPGARRDRARARHADHRLGLGVDATGRFDHDALVRTVEALGSFCSPRPGSRGRAHPGGGDERRAGCGEPRRVRVGGPQARRLRARGDHRRAGSGPLVPGRHPRARPVVAGRSPSRTSAEARPSSWTGGRRVSPSTRSRPAWAVCA